ncbi:two-component regulator propeller domain-containing protein [Hymenobacter terricola]|uniref:two-component regulator propeller domain-containing protein n=1 Tax=Hymenobacter terricola TaxID=2819236 RepID=UPI001CF16F40|nr:two-component regulator propeller domain-containing protein [Hymenobacter terricola]
MFDGQKFRTLSTVQGLPGNHVKDVAAAPDGTLWMGHNYGGVSFVRPDEQVRRCRPRGLGIPAGVYCVFPATSQTIWVATLEAGLFRLDCGPGIPLLAIMAWRKACPRARCATWRPALPAGCG